MTPEQIAIEPQITQQTSPSHERQSSSWDIRNAPRNYLSLVAYQVLSAAFSFAAVWLITRHLGSEGYGGIVAIIAASQVAQVFVNWTSTAVVRFGVDEFIDTEKISRTFWVRLIVLAVNLIVVVLISRLWFPALAGWLKLSPETFWLVIAHFAVTVIWIHVQMSLQAAKLPRVQGLLQMIERALIFAGIFALTAAANLKPFEATICYIIAPAAMAVIGLFRLRHFITARFEIDRAFFRKVFAYSIPLLPFSLVGYFSGSYVDAIFVSTFLSTQDLGIYSVATQINGIALQLPTLANMLLIPFFVSLQKEDRTNLLDQYFRHAFPLLTLVGGCATMVAAFASYFIIPRVFGHEFFAAVGPLWVLLAASALSLPVYAGYASLINATSATYIAMIVGLASAATNICANFWLIPKYGISGCAWATFFSLAVSVALYAALLARQIPISWLILALMPCGFGSVSYSTTENPFVSLFVAVFVAAVIVIFKRESINESFRILRKIRTF